jgi:glycosyltransferase involved in cell wall biosynthesis
MPKINLSFIQYGGLAYAGAQKQAMALARILDKTKFYVHYFWSEPAQDLYSDFIHPRSDRSYLSGLVAAGVEPVEFKVKARDISHPYHPWLETDFFKVFGQYPTDIIFSVRAGHPEFPFLHLLEPMVEWNVFGSVDSLSRNLVYSVGVSPWAQRQYLKFGGDRAKSGYCYAAISAERSNGDLRPQFNIGAEEIVLGFHQRVSDDIFSETALRAWDFVRKRSRRKLRFIILGGSDKYKVLAGKLKLDVQFLPVAFSYQDVSRFLNTLDIFTHSAGAGESLGLAVQEAMAHGLPIVAMTGVNNGHVDVIGDSNPVAGNLAQYQERLLLLVEDKALRLAAGQRSLQRAKAEFSEARMKNYFEALFSNVYQKYCLLQSVKFPVLPLSVYEKCSLRRQAYRLAFRVPVLMTLFAALYRLFKNLKAVLKNS